MEIEAELPDNFGELSDGEKIEELEKLREKIGENESGALKKRIIEELIREYS